MITLSTKKIDGLWFAAGLNEAGEVVQTGFSPSRAALLREMARRAPGILVQRDDPEGKRVTMLLGKLIQGEDADFTSRISLESVTRFQRSIYLNLKRIPRGKVSTYSIIAEAAGHKRAARAAGNCLASNPLPLIIPCHRIVLSSLKIGGYSVPGLDQAQALRLKGRILLSEGVEYEGESVASGCLWKPEA
ncbi:methylated-DNA--[protein]-cysteine S-methyltransferase [Candidatus Bathyarchaeota archaeon]|nr:methylated-DNA--[protein]-cysteine S-methyltransferase [Candidatus Bathyarchaeota archaeon]